MDRHSILNVFVLGNIVLLAILGLLERLGLSADLVVRILFLLVLACLLFAGVRARSMQSLGIFLDNQRMTPFPNGLAMATIAVGAFGYIMWPGSIYAKGLDGLWHPLGVLVGVALMGVLLTPHIRRVAVLTPLELLQQRFNSRLVLLGALVVSGVSVLMVLLANLSFLTALSDRYTTIAPETALIVVLCAVVLPLLAGGLRAAGWLQITMGVLIALGFALPLLWLSFALTGLPLPHFSAFDAFEVIAIIDEDAVTQGLMNAGEAGFLDRTDISPFAGLLMLFGAAFGIFGFTPLIARTLTTETPVQSSTSVNWAVLLLSLLLVSVPLYGLFLYLQVAETLTGMTVEAAARQFPILTSGLDGIGLCGAAVSSTADAIAACGRGHQLVAGDLDIAPQNFLMVLTGLSDAFGAELPQTVSAMLACGALAALIALAGACIIGLAHHLAYDLYAKFLAPRAPMNRINFLVRMAAMAVAVAVYMLMQTPLGVMMIKAPGDVLTIGLALAAGCIMPLFILAIWSKRANSVVALITLAVGLIVTAAILSVSDNDLIQSVWPDARQNMAFLGDKLAGLHPLACGAPGGLVALLTGFVLGRVLPSQRGNQIIGQMSPEA